MIPPYISITTSVILLVLLGVSLYQPWKSRHKKIRIQKGDAAMKPIALIIKGMTCSHCANAVKRAILESGGVSSADVNLAAGTATITGKAYNLIAIGKSIEELGYKVEGRKSPD
jgi:copper chaperone